MQLQPICLDTDNASLFSQVQLLADLHPIKKCLKSLGTREMDEETERHRRTVAKSSAEVIPRRGEVGAGRVGFSSLRLPVRTSRSKSKEIKTS